MKEDIISRVAAKVLQFPAPKPRGPTQTIGGRKYVLSKDWPGGMGDPTEGEDEGEDTGGARVIMDPDANPWRYLWFYDTDRQMLYMWRHSDGNEKLANPARGETSTITRLDRKGEMNRGTHAELQVVEREMRERERKSTESLLQWVEELKTDGQRKVDAIVQSYFDEEVKPKILQKFREIEEGVFPIGFKHDRGSPWTPERGAKGHIYGQIVAKDFGLELLEGLVLSKGVDFEEFDGQAVHWALHETLDNFVETSFR